MKVLLTMISLPMVGNVSEWLAEQDHQALFVSGMDHILDILGSVPDERVDAIILDASALGENPAQTLRTLHQAAGTRPLLTLSSSLPRHLTELLDELEIGMLPKPLEDAELESFIHYTARCFWTRKRGRLEQPAPASLAR